MVALEPWGRVDLVHGQYVGVLHLRTSSVEPSVTVAETDYGCGVVVGIHVDGVIGANVLGHHVVGVEITEQRCGHVFHAVSVTNDVRILGNRLVGIEAVHTQANIKDNVVEGELVHHKSCDVDGLVGANRAGTEARVIGLVKEVFNGRATGEGVAVVVKSAISHVVRALVQQVVCAKHVDCHLVGVEIVHIDVVVAIGVQSQTLAEVAVKLKLVVTDQTVVGHVVVGAHVGDGGV